MSKVIFAAFFMFAVADGFSPDCMELWQQNKPQSCCKYPLAVEAKTQIDTCHNKCKDNKDYLCCYSECTFEISQLFDNGKLRSDKVIATFDYRWLNDSSAKEKWLPVLKTSVETCEKLLPPSIPETETCKTSFNSRFIMDCVIQTNFFNCPASAYNSTSSCDEMKKTLKAQDKCGHSYGTSFWIDISFWYYYEKTSSISISSDPTGSEGFEKL